MGLWGGWGRLAVAIIGACSHSVKTGGREEVGGDKGGEVMVSRAAMVAAAEA